MNEAEYPWGDFQADYFAWVAILARFPEGSDVEILFPPLLAAMSAKYPDKVQLNLRMECLSAAIQTIKECESALVASRHISPRPGKVGDQLSSSALGAVYELVVLQDIRLPNGTQLVKAANRVSFERGGDTDKLPL